MMALSIVIVVELSPPPSNLRVTMELPKCGEGDMKRICRSNVNSSSCNRSAGIAFGRRPLLGVFNRAAEAHRKYLDKPSQALFAV